MIRRAIDALIHRDSNTGSIDRAIIGLGNPGPKYAQTRHNVGFMTVDEIAGRLAAGSDRRRFEAVIQEQDYRHGRVALARPITMMNNSGHAVSQILRWYKLGVADALIVHDELDIAYGRIRLRPGGGPGGHNGVRSIIEQLGTDQFPRLRIGIGRPTSGSTINYVLSRFRPHELEILDEVVRVAADAALCWLNEGLDAAMNRYNRTEIEIPAPARNR